jgi:hypothetical protein
MSKNAKVRAGNPIAEACRKRYGQTTKRMHDRRLPRGGAKNKQRAYREGW